MAVPEWAKPLEENKAPEWAKPLGVQSQDSGDGFWPTVGKSLYHAASPLMAAGHFAVAPIGHEYESEGLIDQTKEAFSVAAKAGAKSLFPKYGDIQHHEEKARERIFPNAPEWAKPSLDIAIGLTTDPAMVALPFVKTIQKGLAISTAKNVTSNPFKRALKEAYTFNTFADEEKAMFDMLAKQADEGSTSAATELVKEVSRSQGDDVADLTKHLDVSRKAKDALDVDEFSGENLAKLVDDFETEQATRTISGTGKKPHPGNIDNVVDYKEISGTAQRQAESIIKKDVIAFKTKHIRKLAEKELKDDPINGMISDIEALGGMAPNNGVFTQKAKELVDKIGASKVNIFKADGGASPMIMARHYGYSSVEDMLEAISKAPTIDKKIAEISERQKEGWKLFEQEQILSKVIDEERRVLREFLGDEPVKSSTKTKAEIRKVTEGKMVGQLVDDVKSMKFHYKELQKATAKAFKEGSKAGAIKNHLKELDKLSKKKALFAVKKEIDTVKSKLSRLYKMKSVPNEFKEQIRYGLGNLFGDNLNRPEHSLMKFLQDKSADNAFVGYDIILEKFSKIADIGLRRNLKTMSLEELREVEEFYQALYRIGRDEGMVTIEGEKLSRDAMIQLAYNSSQRGRTALESATPRSELGKKSKFLETIGGFSDGYKRFAAKAERIEFISRALDNFRQGAVYKTVFKPMVDAQRAEFLFSEKAFKMLDDALAPLKKLGSKYLDEALVVKVSDGVELSITKEQAIMMALNSGNKQNLKAMLHGLDFTKADLDSIIKNKDFFTDADWKAVNKIWDMLESFFPELQKVHRELTGFTLPKVKGKYFPIVVDRRFVQDKRAMIDAFNAHDPTKYWASVEKNMMKTRKGGATALNVYSLDVVGDHLQKITHAISHAVPVNNVQKVLNDKRFKDVVLKSLGQDAYDQFQPWIKNLAKPSYDEHTWARTLKKNATVAILGLKVSTAIVQPLSITGGMQVLSKEFGSGLMPILNEASKCVIAPFEMKKLAHSLSTEMASRSKTWNRELNEFVGSMNKKKYGVPDWLTKSAFSMIRVGDFLGAYPVWHAGYKKMLGQTNDMAKAVEYADSLVRRTQPSSAPKDLPQIMNPKNSFMSWFTMFYSYYNVYQNQLTELYRMGKTGNMSLNDAKNALMYLMIAPPIIKETILGKSENKTPKDYAKAIFSHNIGGRIFARDIANSVLYGFDPQISPVTGSIKAMGKAVKTGKHLEYLRAAGFVFGLPTQQAIITTKALMKLSDGKLDDPFELLLGPKRKEKKRSRR